MYKALSAFGSLASVVIAVAAIWIATTLEEQQAKRDLIFGKLNNVVALHGTYRNLDAIQKLTELSHKALYDFHEMQKVNPMQKVENLRKLVFDNVTHEYADDLPAWLSVFLQSSERVFSCGWQKQFKDSEESSVASTCGKEEVMDAFMSEYAWIYYGMTPGLYCDKTMRNSFNSELHHLETMILEYIQRDFVRRGQDIKVFRTAEERADNEGYVVRPNEKELCSIS